MGNSNRSTGFDLPLKERNDRTMGTKDVAETNCYERRLGILRHGLDDHLADALGCTHDVRGVDCFVCGNEHELFDFVFLCCQSNVIRAEDVVLDGLIRAVFHERNMLVSRRMEDQLRMIFFKDDVQSVEVSYRANNKAHVFVGVVVLELLLEVVCCVFVDVQDHEHFRVLLDDLSAEFGTDGAATAGDKNHLVFDVRSDFVDVVLDLVSAQKVFDLDFTQFGDGDFPVHQLINGRKGLDFGARFLTDVDDVTSVFCFGARERNVDLIDTVLLDEFRDVFPAPFDRDTVDDASLFLFVVIDEAKYIAIESVGTLDLVQDDGTGGAGADDEDPLELVPVLIVMPVCFPGTENAVGIPVQDDADHQDQVRQEIEAAGHRPADDVETADLEDSGECDAEEDGEHFPQTCHGPHVFVQAVRPEADECDDDVNGQEVKRSSPVLFRDGGDRKVKTQPKPHKRSQDAGYDVHEDKEQCAERLAMRHESLDKRGRFEFGRIHSCVSPK